MHSFISSPRIKHSQVVSNGLWSQLFSTSPVSTTADYMVSDKLHLYISVWHWIKTGVVVTIISNLLSCHMQWEKAMATHSSTLVWKIPWVEEPGRLQSMGLLRLGHDWATSLSLFTFMHWRRKWHPTPGFLPGESQGQGSLVGCRLWGHTELDTTTKAT